MVMPYMTLHRRTVLKGVFFTIGVKTTHCVVFEHNLDSHGNFSQNIIRTCWVYQQLNPSDGNDEYGSKYLYSMTGFEWRRESSQRQ